MDERDISLAMEAELEREWERYNEEGPLDHEEGPLDHEEDPDRYYELMRDEEYMYA